MARELNWRVAYAWQALGSNRAAPRTASASSAALAERTPYSGRTSSGRDPYGVPNTGHP
jgi:hypothetical protein